jgi:hypothetical protein
MAWQRFVERWQIWARSEPRGVGRPARPSGRTLESPRAQRKNLAARFVAGSCGLIAFAASAGIIHPSDKLTEDEKIALIRDLSSEYAKAHIIIPRSAKPLDFNIDGTWNKDKWREAQIAAGAAARPGDQVQITKVTLQGDSILIELNGGLKNGKRFMDHVSIGIGSPQPVSNGTANPKSGTTIELNFHKPMESLTSEDVKKLLAPLLDFDQRTATKLYSETLPPEMKAAIAEKRALEGMTREEVLMAMGHPEHKYRETNKEGVDTEDWIYGTAPGKITFVTFGGPKVIKVKQQYAGLGIQTSDQAPIQ